MADQDQERRDLGAMLAPVLRALIAAERPVLDDHGISMWGYSVLTALEGMPARTQAALASSIGADKTRIIGTLDELQAAGHITREPDPADRRARLLSITPEGQRVLRSARARIHAAEDLLLAELPAGERRAFLSAVQTLSTLPVEEILGR